MTSPESHWKLMPFYEETKDKDTHQEGTMGTDMERRQPHEGSNRDQVDLPLNQ